jgi:four helix bundle protein
MGGARRVEDLEAYKLAVELRRRIFRLTKREPVASDCKFVDQIRDAARGGARNISEGFSRFAPKEFRQYLNYSRSSLSEVKDELGDAFDSDYVTETEHNEILALLERTNGAIARLMEYLESATAQRFYEEHRKRRRLREWEKPATQRKNTPKNDTNASANENASANANPNENPNENAKPNEHPNPNENANENANCE